MSMQITNDKTSILPCNVSDAVALTSQSYAAHAQNDRSRKILRPLLFDQIQIHPGEQ